MSDKISPKLNIGVIAEILGVHPETLRIWEKNGLISPERRNKQRLYSSTDMLRLQFIHQLINEKGLNIAGVKHIIQMYPCWIMDNCCGNNSEQEDSSNSNKPCWKVTGSFCTIVEDKADLCSNCPNCK